MNEIPQLVLFILGCIAIIYGAFQSNLYSFIGGCTIVIICRIWDIEKKLIEGNLKC